MLERVQGGLIGETLSRLGVAGLYTVVVLSISESLTKGPRCLPQQLELACRQPSATVVCSGV